MLFAVIMAGGSGTRFWPLSRAKHPKQLLSIVGEDTMIQQTVARINGIVDLENIFIVTNEDQAESVKEQLPDIPVKNVLVEPVGRNTAPCIGLAAVHIRRLDPNAVMLVLPADHLISPLRKFHENVRFGSKLAQETNALITFGIEPTRPETGYGYVQFVSGRKETLRKQVAYKVKTFAEKPTLKTAKRFLGSGDFLWNSGMFMWKVSTVLNHIETNLPEIFEGLCEVEKTIGDFKYVSTLDRVYHQIKGISIDYGVMEHARNVYVVRADFEWSDVGSWEAVFQISRKNREENVARGNHLGVETRNSLVFAREKLIVTVGVEDLIVVDTGDATLICRRDQAQRVKEVVDLLKKKNLEEYL